MPDNHDNDLYLEMVREWQEHPISKRVVQIFQALQYQTQQDYKNSQSREQFEYLRGLEIGYERVVEVLTKEIKEPVKIATVQIPVIERE